MLLDVLNITPSEQSLDKLSMVYDFDQKMIVKSCAVDLFFQILEAVKNLPANKQSQCGPLGEKKLAGLALLISW